MSLQDELLQIALSLKNECDYFSSGWNITFLQAFIRDGGYCVYCGRDVMNEFCVASGDHVLPRRLYPAMEDEVENLVPACAHCNRMKSNYDPSDGNGMHVVLNEELRRQFIDRSKNHIQMKKANYERDFQTGKVPFSQAIERYHRLAQS